MEVLYSVERRRSRRGIFSTKDIVKGTLVRKIVPGVNTQPIKGQNMFCQFLNSFESDQEKVEWVNRCYDLNGTIHEIIDDSQHINHGNSHHYNISRGKGNDRSKSYATKAINAGEEIIEDYGSYGWPVWLAKICNSLYLKIDVLYSKLAPGVSSMQVKYQVKEGEYGMGVFAEEDIKKGTLIWKYHRDVNVRIICNSWNGENELRMYLSTLPSFEKRKDLLIHMYCEHGYCHQLLDDCQFWNHSDTPNTGNHGPDPYNCYALRDIKKGEELFDDYGTYEWPDWYIHLLTEYNVDIDYFTVPDKNRYRNLDISGMVAIECN